MPRGKVSIRKSCRKTCARLRRMTNAEWAAPPVAQSSPCFVERARNNLRLRQLVVREGQTSLRRGLSFFLMVCSVCLLLLVIPAVARAFPWSIDMFRGPAVQPLAVSPRNMPAGTFPQHGGEPPMTRQEAAVSLQNPLSPTATRLDHGKALFATYCAVCHGATGKGDGPVASQMIIPPPNLTTAQPAERTDGYLYATIRNGSIVMPAYDDAMSAAERWQVVLYLRHLQGKVHMP